MSDELPKQRWWSKLAARYKNASTAQKVKDGAIAFVFAVIMAFVALPIAECWHKRHTPPPPPPPPPLVRKVTILVPVQGAARPPDGATAELYEDKISNDIVNTIQNASFVYENRNPTTPRGVVWFQHYPEGKSAEDRQRVAREQILAAAREGRPAVAVIGHTTSQATLEAAPIYAEYQLPVLMAYATKTGIAEELTRIDAAGKRIPRALAFPPPNKVQAQAIAGFLTDKAECVVLFRDAANRAYSDDCGNELVKILENDRVAHKQPPIEVIGDIAIGGPEGRWYNTGDVASAKAEAYVVISMTKPSLEIARQVARSAAKPRFIVFTDGAIDDQLVPRLKPAMLMTGFPEAFIAFPESAVIPPGYEDVFKNGQAVRGLSHAAYFADAILVTYAVAVDTLKEATAKDANTVFAKKLDLFINYNPTNGAEIPGAKLVSAARNYTFLPTGSRKADAKFTLFKIDPSTLDQPAKQGYVVVK